MYSRARGTLSLGLLTIFSTPASSLQIPRPEVTSQRFRTGALTAVVSIQTETAVLAHPWTLSWGQTMKPLMVHSLDGGKMSSESHLGNVPNKTSGGGLRSILNAF